MKIISKYKDYYDYLAGIYGIDEKLILDRTIYSPLPYKPSFISKKIFCICDVVYEMCFIDGKYLFGEELKKYESKKYYSSQKDVIYIDNTNIPIKLKPYETNVNSLLNIPILKLTYSYGRDKKNVISIGKKQSFEINPILKEYDFHRVVSANDMWINLSNFLSRDIKIDNKQTDKEKILSHGFDLKTSFRNIK